MKDMKNVNEIIHKYLLNDSLRVCLVEAFFKNKVVMIKDINKYRGVGKSTVMKALANECDLYIFTNSHFYEYKNKITRLNDLRGRRMKYILLDYMAMTEKQAKNTIDKIRSYGVIPIGFLEVVNNKDLELK